MIEKMRDLIKTQLVCVLATVSGEQPHCSLMSYAVDAECREMFMVTFRNTKKYRNLINNPSVSLLIDSRDEERGAKSHQTRALTVNGMFEEVKNREKREVIRTRLLERHPHLQALADDPNAEFFTVRIKSMQLLEGPVESSFMTVD